MFKYILGFIKNFFNPAVSLLAKIDNLSVVSKKAKVYRNVQVSNSTVGDYSYVGRNSRIVYADVGKFCSIASEVRLGMGTHSLDRISTSPIFTEKRNATKHSWVSVSTVDPYKRVKVGNDVWIGVRAMIMGGVTIGNGAVIGAGAIVTKDVPAYAIVAGIPAKVLHYRFTDRQIEQLQKYPWWEKSEKQLKTQIKLFQRNDDIDSSINELCND